MDQDQARGVMNQLLYGIDDVRDLDDATAVRLADSMIDGRLFAAPVADFAVAMGQTLRAGALHPQAIEMSQRHSESELLEFVRKVARKLDERRPWPPPLFTKLDTAQWEGFGNATAIARINQPMYQISAALGYLFDEVPSGPDKLPVLIIRLRTGEVVAITVSVDPQPASFVLLQRDPGSPAEVISHFQELTGFSGGGVTPISGG